MAYPSLSLGAGLRGSPKGKLKANPAVHRLYRFLKHSPLTVQR